jgi:hypothetical protein
VRDAPVRRARVRGARVRLRAGRRARRLLARGVLLCAIAALPVAFSAWIDPARLVAPRTAEREIARVLASGTAVTDYANYDERAIEKHLAPLRRVRPQVLVLGSSRMQMLRGPGGPGVRGSATAFVNVAVSGATLDDVLGTYGLYDAADRRPRRILLGIDPWMESEPGDGWRALAAERAMVMRRAGIPSSPRRDLLAAWSRAVRRLATPEYFRLSVYSLLRHGPGGIRWRATGQEQNAEKTKLPDGSVVWHRRSEEQIRRAIAWFASSEVARDPRFHDLGRRAPGRDGALERFVRHLRSEGVDVTVVLVPFAAEVYDASRRMSGDSLAAVERELRAMSARAGVRIVGSYDPRAAGVTADDFFDADHLRPEPLARIVRDPGSGVRGPGSGVRGPGVRREPRGLP